MGFEEPPRRRAYGPPGQREAAGAHFRKLGEHGSASDAGPLRSVAPEPFPQQPCRFDIYREDEVRVTAIRFSGGDWHWRLCDAAGRPLADAGGYRTEEECRRAVLALRNEAALATMPACA